MRLEEYEVVLLARASILIYLLYLYELKSQKPLEFDILQKKFHFSQQGHKN